MTVAQPPFALLQIRHDDSNSQDSELAAGIEHALRSTGYGYLREVQVILENGCVLLRGKVPSYYLKQLAQETILAKFALMKLCNDLEVIASSAAPTNRASRSE
jgi:osmotically-inducible protein OsmY